MFKLRPELQSVLLWFLPDFTIPSLAVAGCSGLPVLLRSIWSIWSIWSGPDDPHVFQASVFMLCTSSSRTLLWLNHAECKTAVTWSAQCFPPSSSSSSLFLPPPQCFWLSVFSHAALSFSSSAGFIFSSCLSVDDQTDRSSLRRLLTLLYCNWNWITIRTVQTPERPQNPPPNTPLKYQSFN